VRYVFDTSISVRLALLLDAYDCENEVRSLAETDAGDPGAPDSVILEALRGQTPRPVFVTPDPGRATNAQARVLLARSSLTVVFLRRGWSSLPFHTQAVRLLTIWPEIVAATSRVKVPTAFEISPSARKVQRLGPTAEL